MPVKLQIRRDTASNWSSANPTLAAGEIGLDTTNGLMKVGDGSTVWNSLRYAAAKAPSYTVAGVPSASTLGAGSTIYVSDESGGAVLAFSDGTDWRRVTDRAVIS